jgi:hypothetical protein
MTRRCPARGCPRRPALTRHERSDEVTQAVLERFSAMLKDPAQPWTMRLLVASILPDLACGPPPAVH